MARLNPDNLQRARDLIALYPEPRSALIPTLHVLQEQDGYLSPDGISHVAELFGLTAAEVRGTASFYDMFHLEPVGRYLVAVCTNIACMLQGAYRLLEHAEERLGVAPGGTTADGVFTLEDAECLALCGNAPCVTVNWRFFGDVDTERFDRLVEDLRGGRLDEDVPPHGTLSRVRRSVGLLAAGEPVPSANGTKARTPATPRDTEAPGAPDPAESAGPPVEAEKPRRVRSLLTRPRKAAPSEAPEATIPEPDAASAEPPAPPARRRSRKATAESEPAPEPEDAPPGRTPKEGPK